MIKEIPLLQRGESDAETSFEEIHLGLPERNGITLFIRLGKVGNLECHLTRKIEFSEDELEIDIQILIIEPMIADKRLWFTGDDLCLVGRFAPEESVSRLGFIHPHLIGEPLGESVNLTDHSP